MGEFISEDPIGFRAGDSNLTRYVGNNPTNWVDPSGLDGDNVWGGGGLNPIDIVIGVGAALKALIQTGFDKFTRGGLLDAGEVGDGTLNQINNNPDDPKPHPINPRPAIPSAGYCNQDPPPECEPDPGKQFAEQITQETLKNLLNDAVYIKKVGSRADSKWGENTKIAVGVSESGKTYISSNSGSYGKGLKLIEALAARRGFILVKTDGGLGQTGWHAEGRLIQNGITKEDRIVGMGVSDKMCDSCAEDVKKYNIKTLNGKYTVVEYPNLPANRPGQEKVKFDPPRKKKKKC